MYPLKYDLPSDVATGWNSSFKDSLGGMELIAALPSISSLLRLWDEKVHRDIVVDQHFSNLGQNIVLFQWANVRF